MNKYLEKIAQSYDTWMPPDEEKNPIERSKYTGMMGLLGGVSATNAYNAYDIHKNVPHSEKWLRRGGKYLAAPMALVTGGLAATGMVLRVHDMLKKQAENKPEHDYKPAIVGGVADVPAAAAVGWVGKKLGQHIPGKYGEEIGIGLSSGVVTAGAADYLQRRAEKRATLVKQALKHVPGVGKHNDKPDSAFDAKELAKGRKVEKEHVDTYQATEDIAKDHLSEVPDYYTRLGKMEREGKMQKSAKLHKKLKRLKKEYDEASEQAVAYGDPRSDKKKKKHREDREGKKERH